MATWVKRFFLICRLRASAARGEFERVEAAVPRGQELNRSTSGRPEWPYQCLCMGVWVYDGSGRGGRLRLYTSCCWSCLQIALGKREWALDREGQLAAALKTPLASLCARSVLLYRYPSSAVQISHLALSFIPSLPSPSPPPGTLFRRGGVRLWTLWPTSTSVEELWSGGWTGWRTWAH